MKRISAALALTAALSLGVAALAQTTTTQTPATTTTTVQAPASFQDVPAGHWAREAVEKITAAGLITGFPDGTYRGNENLTRYQAALIISRLLDYIAAGTVPGGDAAITPEIADALQNATQELASDLAQLGVRVAELEDNAVTRDDLARVEELANEALELARAGGAGGGDTAAPPTDTAAPPTDPAAPPADQAAAGMDADAIAQLNDQVEAASIAADTALAQARELQDRFDALQGNLDDLSSQLGELGATVQGQADSIAALNDLVVLLNQDVLSLQDRATALESSVTDLQTQVEEALATFATQEDLEALREFTTLLRRDQTALTDRVTELETRVTAVETRVTGLEGRVTELERNAFTITGTLTLTYYSARTWLQNATGFGSDFDVDRLMNTAFSTGVSSSGGTNQDYADLGGAATVGAGSQVSDNPNGLSSGNAVNVPGDVRVGFGLNFAFRQRNLTGANNAFPITLGLGFSAGGFNFGSSQPVSFTLNSVGTRFTVGTAPLLITFGQNINFKFTDYAFNNATTSRGDGLVADLDLSGVIPLNPKLTVVVGARAPVTTTTPAGAATTAVTAAPVATTGGAATTIALGAAPALVPATATSFTIAYLDTVGAIIQTDVVPVTAGATSVTVTPPTAAVSYDVLSYTTGTAATSVTTGGPYFFGTRLGFNLLGLNTAVYYAQEGVDIASPAYGTPAGSQRVYGFDARGTLFNFLTLAAEYSIADPGDFGAPVGGPDGSVATYVSASTKFGIFSVGANYRRIDPGYTLAAALSNDDTRPFAANQVGFGANLAVDLGFVSVAGDVNSFTELSATAASPAVIGGVADDLVSHLEFGVSATLRVIGFAITPSFRSVNETEAATGTAFTFTRTSFGVSAIHNGAAPDALIRGLNLTLSYNVDNFGGSIYTSPWSRSVLLASADYTLAIGTISIRPEVLFSTTSNGPEGAGYATSAGVTASGGPASPPAVVGGTSPASVAAANGGDNLTRFRYGITASTGPILFGSIGFDLMAVSDSVTHTGGLLGGAAWTASTQQVMAGVTFSRFFFENSSAAIRYANRTDINRRLDSTLDGAATYPDVYGVGTTMNGLYLNFTYAGLSVDYGIFNFIDFGAPLGTGGLPVVNWGNAFRVSYGLKF